MDAHPYILLLGAGFSKNFGAFLSSELWAALFSQRPIQKSSHLRQRMLQVPLYEDLFYEIVIQKKASPEDQRAFTQALGDTLGLMDETIARITFQHRIDYAAMNKQLMSRFCGKDDMHPGLIFTLNQDLYFERHYKEDPEPNLPGLRRHIFGQNLFKDPYGLPLRDPEDLLALPTAQELKAQPIHHSIGNFSLIKLHGAVNFRSARDPRLPVIGYGAVPDQEKEPLLQAYVELFQEALNHGKKKLLIIGYSFQNPTVNTILLHAMEEGHVEIFVINPVDPWWARQAYQAGIFENLSAYFPYDLHDLFMKNRSGDTVAWKEVRKQFFEIA